MCVLERGPRACVRLTLSERGRQQHRGLGHLLWVGLHQEAGLGMRLLPPGAEGGELGVELELLLQAGADLLDRKSTRRNSSHL